MTWRAIEIGDSDALRRGDTVAAIAGGLVYLSLNFFLVRPMQRITFAMERFRADPEDPAAQIQLSGRRDEIGRAVDRNAGKQSLIMCAAGTMPGALHVLWRAAQGGYHMEYGYSCMGYEIPASLGVKMADPTREVYVWVGDGTLRPTAAK